MDSEKRRYLKITSIFVALEAVFSYYLVGLLLIGYRPGHLLLGWSNGKVIFIDTEGVSTERISQISTNESALSNLKFFSIKGEVVGDVRN